MRGRKKNWLWILGIVLLLAGLFLFKELRAKYKMEEMYRFQEQMKADAEEFCKTVADAFVSGEREQIEKCKAEGTEIEHIEAYSELGLAYDDMRFYGLRDPSNGVPLTCIIRYQLLSDIPEALKETIPPSAVYHVQEKDYVFQTIGLCFDEAANAWTYQLYSWDLYCFLPQQQE